MGISVHGLWLHLIGLTIPLIVTMLVSATYPLDITKTRLQIQGEVGHGTTVVSSPHRGMLRTAYGIGRLISV